MGAEAFGQKMIFDVTYRHATRNGYVIRFALHAEGTAYAERMAPRFLNYYYGENADEFNPPTIAELQSLDRQNMHCNPTLAAGRPNSRNVAIPGSAKHALQQRVLDKCMNCRWIQPDHSDVFRVNDDG